MRPPRKMMPLLRVLAIISFSFFSVRIVDGQEQLCFDNGNYTTGGSFQYYLDYLLGSIATTNSSTLNDDGLFNASTSVPQSSDVVEVMGYCRGDQTPDACRSCLNIAALEIRQMCPRYKQAVLFRDECTLKYSNGSMYGVVSDTLYWYWNCTAPASSWDVFKNVLNQLLRDLGTQAASGGLRKYAQGNSSVDLSTLYAAVMCSPDLSDQQCTDCLVTVISDLMPGCIQGYARVPSCQVAYNNSRFFNLLPAAAPSPSPPPPPPGLLESPPTTGNKSSSKVWIAVGVSAPSVVLIGVAIFLALTWKRKPRQSHESSKPDEVVLESLRYNLDTIMDATDNFSEANKLGEGGFGYVFLGTLPNGQQIAVKQLSKDSGQGQMEFKNEVVLLARLQHKNLVRLLGFCLEGSERLLVYEFLPNLSLDQFIFDHLKRGSLRWDIRYKIIAGIAQGLLYLHEESGHRIVHRDLKASNILLDGDMNPRLSDFGMARLFKIDQTQANTSRIVGTHGYMAPEYMLHGQFSIKSDVFSFGVLVLEIVSGRRNLEFLVGEHREVLISRVWRNWCEGKISSIVDPLVKTGYTMDIVRCIHIGLLCVQEDLAIRPTMASIIHMLNRHSTTLPVPKQPAFSTASQILPEPDNTLDALRRSNTETSTGSYLSSELSHTKPYPR